MSKKPKKIKVLLTGGASGGHIYPLVAVARELYKRINESGYRADIRYFGDPGRFRIDLETAGLRVARIAASKWRRYVDARNILEIFRLPFGFAQALFKMFFFMPHLCFSKGGPGAFAVTSAARFYAVPVVIHESDAVPGLANKMGARSARLVEVAFDSAKDSFPPGQVTHTVGNPVREELLKEADASSAERGAAKVEFGFNPQTPVLLILGGSQGAEKINNFVLEHVEKLAEKTQILHQTGMKNYESHKQQFDFLHPDPAGAALKSRYRFAPYFERDLGKAYSAADVVVARAGAGIIFELAALGKPAILVPIPDSANGHQRANAHAYAQAGAAVVVEEENLLAGILISQIEKILGDQRIYEAMSASAKKFYIPNSARLIADDALKTILG